MRLEAFLSYFPKITHKRFKDVLSVCSSIRDIQNAPAQTYKALGWNDELQLEFRTWLQKADEEKMETILAQEHIETIMQDDPRYPTLLLDVYDPPHCLFVRGTLEQDTNMIAVVGTRKYSPYGKQVTEMIVSDLAKQGLTTVSGLALGIDGIAHETTLRAGGRTIAVLGGGINTRHIAPREHINMAERIISTGGAILSEYPPGAIPNKYTFPRRNRIIAGMTRGVLVTEAGEDSGSLITAKYALDNSRDVFAIPHPITTEHGRGPNELIKAGAFCVTSAEDIFTRLSIVKSDTQSPITPPSLSPSEEILYKLLSREPVLIDILIKSSSLPQTTVMSTLTLMEMKGAIKNIGGMRYIRS